MVTNSGSRVRKWASGRRSQGRVMVPLRRVAASEGGFTLVEILVALTLMLIASVAFVPLFVYVAEASDANQAQLVATSLANSVIEQIRSLPYGEVGTIDGNPAGVIPHERTETVGGRTYTIRTDIWWVNDPSDDAGGNDPIPYDYKRVKVTVTAPGLFAGSVTTSVDIRTLVALEGEEEVFPGGNVLAQVFRGWRTPRDEETDEETVEGVRIDLTSPASPPETQRLWTDERGQALFAVLDEGNYTVTANASALGMMIHPLQVEQPVAVSEGMTSQVTFDAERPCHLALQLQNKDTRAPIRSGGQVILVSPVVGDIPLTFTPEMNGVIPDDQLGDLWPVGEGYPGRYDLKVLADGYLPYDLQADPDRPWDGTFAFPGETKTVTIDLVPATASVTVTSATTDAPAPVTGATVEIYVHTWVYDAETGSWTDSCSASPLQTALTGADGRASFHLPDNSPHEPLPELGQYTRYCVRVSATGYLDFGPEHGAFWVSGGQQMTEAGAIDTYSVSLRPDFRRIRVRTERSNGDPRDHVRILVTGPGGYRQEKRTGAEGTPGEAVFENLARGTYHVFRREGSRWVDEKILEVQWGEYFVTYPY